LNATNPHAKTVLDRIQEDLGRVLRELGNLSANQSALHVKVDTIAQSFKRLADDRMRDRFDLERYGRRIQNLEHQIALISAKPDLPDWQPDARDITGTHDFAVIKAQFEETRGKLKAEEERKRESMIWWKRQRWVWIAAIFITLFTGGVSGCVTFIVTKAISK